MTTPITDAELDAIEAFARVHYYSKALWCTRLVAEVRRLRVEATPPTDQKLLHICPDGEEIWCPEGWWEPDDGVYVDTRYDPDGVRAMFIARALMRLDTPAVACHNPPPATAAVEGSNGEERPTSRR